jgi:AAA domain
VKNHPPPDPNDAARFRIETLDGIGFLHTLLDWLDRDLSEPVRIMGEWLTTTSRVIVSAPTGLGKTNWVIALGLHAAAGVNFLRWRAYGKFRVLYIDGEMSRRLLRKRLKDAARRLNINPNDVVFYPLSHEDIPDFQPLNSEAGRKFVLDFIKKKGGVDLAIFDNIMALTTGDMKDEESWQQTLPLVSQLTAQEVGQIWVHHTGYNKDHGYGTSTREWRMDTVMLFAEQQRPDTDVSFSLKFTKARERTPETRRDFDEISIALLNDEWTCSTAPGKRKEPSPLGKKFLDALQNAFADGRKIQHQSWQAITADEWEAECAKRGLIDLDGKCNSARSLMSKYRRELIAFGLMACDFTDEKRKLVWPLWDGFK